MYVLLFYHKTVKNEEHIDTIYNSNRARDNQVQIKSFLGCLALDSF